MRALRLALVLLAGSAAGAHAQVVAQVLPETSRSEQNLNTINRSLSRQQEGLGASQQNQFEVNQLRGQIQRRDQFPTVTGPRGCAPGAVGC